MKKIIALIFLSLVICSSLSAQLGPSSTPSRPIHELSKMEKSRIDPKSYLIQPTYWLHDSSWYSQWSPSSSSWLMNEREILTYTANGFLSNDLYLSLNASNQWENLNRYFNSFGSTGNLLSYTGQTWDNTPGAWFGVQYSHYDQNGRNDTSWYKQYDKTNHIYQGGSQYLYTFNASFLMTEMLIQNLNLSNGSWVNMTKVVNSYNSSNLQTGQLNLFWSVFHNNWVNKEKFDYSFDASNYPTGYLYFTWDTISGQWSPSIQATYTNSTGGLPLVKLYKHWQTSTLSWLNYEQMTTIYNSNNIQTEVLDELWNSGTSSWGNNTKSLYTYYTNNYTKTSTQYLWNPNNGTWLETYYSHSDSLGATLENYFKFYDPQNFNPTFGDRYTYTYNAQHFVSEYDHFNLDIPTLTWNPTGRRQYTYDQNGNNTIQLDQLWNIGSSSWENNYKIENFFGFTTGLWDINPRGNFIFYPNPLKRGMQLNCSGLNPDRNYHIELVNMTGRVVLESEVAFGQMIPMPSSLSPGIYMMRLFEEGAIVKCDRISLSGE
ncbi:MAG: T9SS type A sorting domain-containing protein [Bacteroidota bacterium]